MRNAESAAAIDHLKAICMALPEAAEDYAGVGNPAFKVREKIFAMQHPAQRPGHENRPSLWVKAPRGFQEMIVGNDPEHFFVPPYVGQHGWVGIFLDIEPDWDLVESLIEDSYRMTAPKKLQAQIPSRS